MVSAAQHVFLFYLRDVTCAGRCLLSGGLESRWFPGVPFAAAAMDRGRESWVRRAGRPLVKPVILGHRTFHREATGRTMHGLAGAGRAGDCAPRTRVGEGGRWRVGARPRTS